VGPALSRAVDRRRRLPGMDYFWNHNYSATLPLYQKVLNLYDDLRRSGDGQGLRAIPTGGR